MAEINYNEVSEVISKEQMQSFLSQINEQLSEIGKHGEIIICGGAAMTLMFNAL